MKKLCIVLLTVLFTAPAFCQKDNSLFNNLLGKLKKLSSEQVSEKAYLQFDKPYYASGDTMYFKAYVVMGDKHEPSSISGVLHVNLINTQNKIDQSIKLQLVNGVAWGDFALPDSLPRGSYRVRAYTQWMRNEGDQAFFEKVFPVISTTNNQIPKGSTHNVLKNNKRDVQFFPEGGDMLSGVTSKVAFKAVDANGIGINVKGTITDSVGKVITSFASAHAGMGFFTITPSPNQLYKARLSYPDGTSDVIELPRAKMIGISLQTTSDGVNRERVDIVTSDAYFKENRNKPVYLLIFSGGLATTVTTKLDSPLISLALMKNHLHSGVTRITLFTADKQPQSERLIFVNNPDQIDINLSSSKNQYTTRENVQFNLVASNAQQPTAGNFSVAVIDETMLPDITNNESSIVSYLLLSSDLKGYIENPDYYFTNKTDKAADELDLVMLTHGYRRFEWKKVMSDPISQPDWQPETSLQITGQVKSLSGKPAANSLVTLLPQGKALITQQVDGKGNFSFKGLVFTDTAKFILQAVNTKGKNDTELLLNKDANEPLPVAQFATMPIDSAQRLSSLYIKSAERRQQQLKASELSRSKMLKEVKINAVRQESNYRSSNLVGPGHADQVLVMSQVKTAGTSLRDVLPGLLHGVTFTARGQPILAGMVSGPMLVVVDGAVVDADNAILVDMDPNTVETIEVLKYANAGIYGMAGGNGVLIINTKQGGSLDIKDILSKGILPIKVAGFYKARTFYSPQYQHAASNTLTKDTRSTIYWQPELTTDSTGKGSFSFYNTDSPGTYKVIVEGMDKAGHIGRTICRYTVK